MSFEGLEPVSDVSAGAWIAPRLCGFGGRVCCIVPAGFAGYARVLHPPADAGGRLAAWAQVCELTGRIAHPLMQWHKISTVPPTGSLTGASSWPGSDPEVGNLPAAILANVLEILVGFTVDPGDCYHAVWDGWGWQHRDGATATVFASHPSDPRRFRPPPPPPRSRHHRHCPRSCLPARD